MEWMNLTLGFLLGWFWWAAHYRAMRVVPEVSWVNNSDAKWRFRITAFIEIPN